MTGIANLLPIESNRLLDSIGTWSVASGNVTLATSREQANHPTNGALRVYTNSADPFTVTTGDVEVAAQFTGWPIRGFAWVYSPSTVNVTAEVAVTTVDETVSASTTTLVPALQWTLVSAEQSEATTAVNQIAAAALNISVADLGVDTALFIAGPVLSTPLAVTFNQFAASVWTRLPDYLQSSDGIQTDPDFPLLRFLDVATINAQKIYDLWDEIRYIPPDDGDLKLSSLAHPDAAPMAWLQWLSRLVGVDLVDPTTGYTTWSSIQSILDVDYVSDGTNEPGATWLEWTGRDDDGNWIGSTGDGNDDLKVTWEEIETLAPGVVNLEDKLRWQVSTAVTGLRGGTNDALVTTAQEMLTGSKYVRIDPNADGDPFRIRVVTLTSETEDIATMLKALEAAAPAGFEIACTTTASVEPPPVNEDGYQPPTNQGTFSNTTTNTGPWTVGWGSYTPTPGEFVVAALSGRTALGSEPVTPTGWTKVTTVLAETGIEDLRLSVYTRRLTGSDALVFDIPADWSQASVTVTAFDSVGIIEVLPLTNTGGDSATHLPPVATAETNGASVLAIAAAATNSLAQRLGFLVPRDFSTAGTVVGGGSVGSAVLVGYRIADAGEVPSPTVRCYNITSGVNSTTLGWAGVTLALRPISTLPPSPASGVTISSTTETSALISWTIEGSPAGFDVLLDGEVVDSVAADVSSYEFTGLTSGTEYTFGVVATNPSGAASATSTVTGSTSAVPASPVEDLGVSSVAATSAILTWTAPGDAAGFNVYVDGVLNQSVTAAAFATAGDTVTITGLSPYTAYTVEVRSVNASNTEATGDTASFTTQSETAVHHSNWFYPSGDSLTMAWDPTYPISAGQLVLAGIVSTPGTFDQVDMPTGWTLQYEEFVDLAATNFSGSNARLLLRVYKYQVTSPSDPALSVTLPASWSSTFATSGFYVILDGVEDIEGVAGSSTNGGSASITAPSITTFTDGSQVVALSAWADDQPVFGIATTMTTANGFTEVITDGGASDTYRATYSVAVKTVAAAGSTVTGPTWSLTSEDGPLVPEAWRSVTFVARPFGGLPSTASTTVTSITATTTARTAHVEWAAVVGPASTVELFTSLDAVTLTSQGVFGPGITETWLTGLTPEEDYYFILKVDGETVATTTATMLLAPFAGNVLTLDASDYSTLTTLNNKVSQWNDTSGLNNHFVQATTAKQPTISRDYGGAPVVIFDDDDVLTLNGDDAWFNIGPDTDLTLQIKFYTRNYTDPETVYEATSTTWGLFTKGLASDGTDTGWSIGMGTSHLYASACDLNSFKVGVPSMGGYGPNMVPMHLALRFDEASITLFVNGMIESVRPRDPRMDITNNLDVVIGAFYASTGFSFTGGIYQITVDTLAITDAQIATNAASWTTPVGGQTVTTFNADYPATVTVAGEGSATTNASSVAISWGSYTPTAGDVVVLALTARTVSTDEPTTPTDWTQIATRLDSGLRTSVYAKTLAGGDAVFAFTAPSAWIAGSGSFMKYAWVAYRNVASFETVASSDTGTPTSASYTAPTFSTASEKVAVDIVSVKTDLSNNGIEYATSNGFTLQEWNGGDGSLVAIAQRQCLPGSAAGGTYRLYNAGSVFKPNRPGDPWHFFRVTLTPVARSFTPRALRPLTWINMADPVTYQQTSGYVDKAGFYGFTDDLLSFRDFSASGGTRPQSNVATLNSQPVLDFDGNDYMTALLSPHLYNGSKVLIAVVWNPGTVSTTPYYERTLLATARQVDDQVTGRFSVGLVTNPTALTVYMDSDAGTVIDHAESAVAVNTAQVTTFLLDPANATAAERSKIWLGSTSTPSATNAASASPSRRIARKEVYLGAEPSYDYAAISGYLDGYIAEIVVLVGAMATDANRILLRDYLTTKWGL